MPETPNAPKCPRCGAPVTPDAPEGLCPRCLMQLSLSAPTNAPGGGVPSEAKPPPLVSDIAARFPQLEILECLGRGGMGVVYKARQPKLNRLVALKILAREKEGDPHFAERFLREAQALARLNHQNIVTVYDFGEADGLFYLLMEYVDGMNLRELLRSRKMTPEEAVAIVPRICEALQYAHEQGIVHRDIKPENILLDKQGRLKIADFGIAKILGTAGADDALTGGRSVGTPHYMAPEQVEKPGTVDHRADIFSLGVVFYEMLTGELPLGKFSAPSRMVQVDVRLDEVVLRALEKEPDRRYQQASQVKTQVENIVRTPPVIGGQPAAPLPPVKPAAAPFVTSPALGAPRYSRFAIFGAIWAASSLFVPLAWVVYGLSPNRAPHFGLGRTEIVIIAWPLMFFPALFGFTAPFGTTILGWLGIAQIRKSSGRLQGLGLAVFDGLLFPLLIMAAFIFMVWFVVIGAVARGPSGQWLRQNGNGEILLMVWLLASLLTSGFAGYWIVRAVWRAVNQPLGGGGTTDNSVRLSPLAIAGTACVIITTLMIFSMMAFNGELLQLQASTASVGLLVTIVLGILAISQIRSSQGRYRGYGLAIFPLAMCPFLMLLFGTSYSRQTQIAEDSDAGIDTPTLISTAPEPIAPDVVPPALPAPFGWRSGAAGSLSSAMTDMVNGIRGFYPPGTVFYPPVYAPGGKLPVFGPLIERTLAASDGTNNYWFNLETGQPIVETTDPHAKDNPNDDEEARQWQAKVGADVAVVLYNSPGGLAGVDMAAMRVAESEWDTAMPLLIMGPMSASQTEDHIFMKFESNTVSTYYFKIRNGVMGILQITGFRSNPPGMNIRYKLVQAATNNSGDVPQPVAQPASHQMELSPAVHDNLQARFNAASGITAFPERDAAMAGIAADAARAGDAAIVKQSLGKMLAFPSRDTAAAASAREFLQQGDRAEAYDAAQSILNFPARDEVLVDIAKESAKAGDATVAKESLKRITNFTTHDDTTLESARLLVKAGLRPDALEVARTITNFTKRDEALQELAR